MSVYVDTSALYAVLDADDDNHSTAKGTWVDLLNRHEELMCSNYVLVESFALVQHRLGIEAARALQEDIVPILSIYWIDQHVHQVSVAAMLTAGRSELSLVDCASFECMRRLGLRTAFTFDHHFTEQGFQCIPQ